MKKFLFPAIASIGLLFSGCLLASPQEGTYFGTQFSLFSYDETGISEVNPAAAIFRYGGYKNSNFSIEFRLGTGLQDENISGTAASLKFNGIYGFYAVGHIIFSESYSIYGLMGGSRSEVTITTSGISVSDYSEGFSLGLGAKIEFRDNIALNIEYMSYIARSNLDISALGVGLVFDF